MAGQNSLIKRRTRHLRGCRGYGDGPYALEG